MLELISGLGVGLFVVTFITILKYERDLAKIRKEYSELLRFTLARKDPGAFLTAFPKPDMDKVKQEEEQKNRKEIKEYNDIMLRDSVSHGVTIDEIKRFGFDANGINA